MKLLNNGSLNYFNLIFVFNKWVNFGLKKYKYSILLQNYE
jgi:hypothetical protein